MSKSPEEMASKKKKKAGKPINIHFELSIYEKIMKASEEEGLFPGQFVRYAVHHYLSCVNE